MNFPPQDHLLQFSKNINISIYYGKKKQVRAARTTTSSHHHQQQPPVETSSSSSRHTRFDAPHSNEWPPRPRQSGLENAGLVVEETAMQGSSSRQTAIRVVSVLEGGPAQRTRAIKRGEREKERETWKNYYESCREFRDEEAYRELFFVALFLLYLDVRGVDLDILRRGLFRTKEGILNPPPPTIPFVSLFA